MWFLKLIKGLKPERVQLWRQVLEWGLRILGLIAEAKASGERDDPPAGKNEE